MSKPTSLGGELSCLERVLELGWADTTPRARQSDDLLSAPIGSSAYT